MAGCLGGGDDDSGSDDTQYIEAKGSTGAEGEVEGMAQAQPETVSTTVDLPLPMGNITKATFTISVEDGDPNTNPDQVSGSLDSTGDGDYNETLQSGNTPYQTTVEMRAPEGFNLPQGWRITIQVVLQSSNDQWPGPMIWRGYADTGFSYNVSVEYTYLTPTA